MIRLRVLLEGLSYDDLVRRGVIPDLVSVMAQTPTLMVAKRYSPFVYASKAYSEYGMFMDYVVRAGLRSRLPGPFDLGTDPVAPLIPELPAEVMASAVNALHVYQTSNNMNDIARYAHQLVTLLYQHSDLPEAQLQASVPTLVNICKELAAKWTVFAPYLTGTVRYNTAHSYEGVVEGHPDIDTDIATLDIKTTASFGKMAPEACLQVLGYYALRKVTNPDMRYVGFVLPMQREIAIYDVSTWNSTPYLTLLATEARKRTRGPDVADVLATFFQQVTLVQAQDCMAACGHHIHKGKTIEASLTEFSDRRPNRPCQLFITNPRSGKRSAATPGQVAAAAPLVRTRNLTVFIHAPYVINLCANVSEIRDGKLIHWQQDILNGDLQLGVVLGCKGVVVHTGMQKLRTLEEARNTMYHMVATALQYATEDCKLLLETPCGEGTEICTRLEELGEFCHLFSPEQRKKLGLCVDTCHVFAAGYDPLVYLQHWHQHVKVPICLVHFNDSKDTQGSHRDRHAMPGTGNIGAVKMQAIADWCVAHSIPMVIE